MGRKIPTMEEVTEPMNKKEPQKTFNCNECPFAFTGMLELNSHIENNHAKKDEAVGSKSEKRQPDYECSRCKKTIRTNIGIARHSELYCEQCEECSSERVSFDIHMGVKHRKGQPFACDKCDFSCDSMVLLNQHLATEHGFSCSLCEYSTKIKEDLEKHVQTSHINVKVDLKTKDQIVIQCELCEYRCRLNIQLNKHMLLKHANVEHLRYTCELCPFTAHYILSLWNHRETAHADTTPVFVPKPKTNQDLAIAYLAEQNLELLEEMETMKKDFRGAFEEFANGIEENMILMRDESNNNSKVIKDAIEGVLRLVKKEEPAASKETTKPQEVPSKPAKKKPANNAAAPVKPRSEYQAKTKVLYVADSVGRNVEFPIVEGDARCVIKTAKAYSSVYDNTAKWPENNFTKVAKEELAKKPFDCLVMSAPTVDITNLDTSNLKQSDNTTRYQESVLISCQNIFSVAERSLKEYPNLKNVVIMEHAPRYDTGEVDPTGLKEALAKYANNIFNQLWIR